MKATSVAIGLTVLALACLPGVGGAASPLRVPVGNPCDPSTEQGGGPQPAPAVAGVRAWPGEEWGEATPEEAGLDRARLDEVAYYLGGRGCVVRHGLLVYHWGDHTQPGDVASAAKPWYATLLFQAVQEGLLPDLDAPVVDYEPRLAGINPKLHHKDAAITFRHMANQVSGYGVKERPGAAFNYNDWQMALFVDTLITRVYKTAWATVDEAVLHPRLTRVLQCEDRPSLLAFGPGDRAGRLAVSPRDFARFGWLYLNEGRWNGQQVLDRRYARRAVRSPLPNSTPRTSGLSAEMIPGQRTLGSRALPDDQTDHKGSYSWSWWVNGVDRQGRRMWPDAPADVFAALGHANGQRGMACLPSLDMVMSWNDTTLGERPKEPHPLNEAFRLLRRAARNEPLPGQVVADTHHPAWLVRNTDQDRDGRPDPFFMCGPGDPEGFLYLGPRRPDGTRDGDQERIIARLEGTGANCLYLQVIRSHGGDGDATHNPFIDGDPTQGLNETVLQQWQGWFERMDEAGIVVYLFIYDDNARVWDTGDKVGPQERAFLETLVRRFDHLKNLIWCVAEEYEERYSPARVTAIARTIRDADTHRHVVAVHRLNGLDFDEFAEDRAIQQFAVQYNVSTADALHAGVVEAWRRAQGRYSLNLSEAADYGFGATARRKHWAAALGGAYAMALGWTFQDEATPSDDDLRACGHLVRFLESTDFSAMAPNTEYAAGGTAYLLANPGHGYIAYAPDASQDIAIRAMTAGRYDLTWLDPATGTTVELRDVALAEGDCSLAIPDKFQEDAALWIRRSQAPFLIREGRWESLSLSGVR